MNATKSIKSMALASAVAIGALLAAGSTRGPGQRGLARRGLSRRGLARRWLSRLELLRLVLPGGYIPAGTIPAGTIPGGTTPGGAIALTHIPGRMLADGSRITRDTRAFGGNTKS